MWVRVTLLCTFHAPKLVFLTNVGLPVPSNTLPFYFCLYCGYLVASGSCDPSILGKVVGWVFHPSSWFSYLKHHTLQGKYPPLQDHNPALSWYQFLGLIYPPIILPFWIFWLWGWWYFFCPVHYCLKSCIWTHIQDILTSCLLDLRHPYWVHLCKRTLYWLLSWPSSPYPLHWYE